MNQKWDDLLLVVLIKLIVMLLEFFLQAHVSQENNRSIFCFYHFVITYLTGLTFSRGCCEVKDGSPTCAENNGEDDYEFNDGINHGRYFRCNEELCNIGPLEFELPDPGRVKYGMQF